MLPHALPLPGVSPLAAWRALHGRPHLVWLDSALVDGRLGRYSYVAAEPFVVLRAKARQVSLDWADGRHETLVGDPMLALRRLMRRFARSARDDLPPFQGGAIGYFGYELGHHTERLPFACDDLGIPDLVVGLYDTMLSWDHLTERAWIVSGGGPDDDLALAERWARALAERLAAGRVAPAASDDLILPAPPTSTFGRADYLRAVERVKEHLARGDVYQVNLTQRFTVRPTISATALYPRLRESSASPFGAYLDCGDGLVVLSASPELFLRLEGDRIETRPMKGTRQRGLSAGEDQELADDLMRSAKDRAENVMIVDLLRNDLGRICTTGTVEVPELFVLERYPTVHQLVSAVRGRLLPGLGPLDALRACLPGGSITGAPKIRAIEIITALERVVRGVYCGAIGYVGFDGAMVTSVAIRTIVVMDGRALVQVGGGIVADSDPASEYEETLHKARGAFAALGYPGGRLCCS